MEGFPKTNTNKCNHSDCNKKLKISDFPCKCEQTFCGIHRNSASHNCTFNYKEHGKKILEKTVIGCKNEKVIMI